MGPEIPGGENTQGRSSSTSTAKLHHVSHDDDARPLFSEDDSDNDSSAEVEAILISHGCGSDDDYDDGADEDKSNRKLMIPKSPPMEVIEISSTDEDDGGKDKNNNARVNTEDVHVTQPSKHRKGKKTVAAPASDAEVIYISSDSSSREKKPKPTAAKASKWKPKSSTTTVKPLPLFLDEDSASGQDEDEVQQGYEDRPFGEHAGGVSDVLHTANYNDLDDGSILVFNEPRSARKPLRIVNRPGPLTTAGAPSSSASSAFPHLSDLTPRSPRTGSAQPGLARDRADKSESRTGTPQLSQPRRRRQRQPPLGAISKLVPTPLDHLLDASETNTTVIFLDNDEDNLNSVITAVPTAATGLPASAITTPRSQPKRRTARSERLLEQARREQYAQSLFDELNRDVFGGGLPTETKLNWNKRLLTTAGRAKWHRSRSGDQTTEVELAVKILDCDERIRNTLSHEMCHLACWIINKNPKEAHGRIFKSWAAKVMRKRPEIIISTRHNYEISHPYQWKCDKCFKTYGRFSKSIDPDACVCGACKVGRLVPQFKGGATTATSSDVPARLTDAVTNDTTKATKRGTKNRSRSITIPSNLLPQDFDNAASLDSAPAPLTEAKSIRLDTMLETTTPTGGGGGGGGGGVNAIGHDGGDEGGKLDTDNDDDDDGKNACRNRGENDSDVEDLSKALDGVGLSGESELE